MKAITLTEYAKVSEHIPGKVEMLQCEKPTPGPEDVLIRIAYASICGSDAHVVRGNLTPELEAAIRSMLPFHMGHEISGVIEDLGDKAKEMGLKVGDRITANYTHFCNSCYFCRTGQENFCEHPEAHFDGMAEYVCWHMSQVYKIPDNVSLLHASQTEPLSIALNACKTVGVHFGSRVLVSGAGPIGLYATQLARKAGASLIVVRRHRRGQARHRPQMRRGRLRQPDGAGLAREGHGADRRSRLRRRHRMLRRQLCRAGHARPDDQKRPLRHVRHV